MEIKLTNTYFLSGKWLMKNIMRAFIFLFCTTLFALTPGHVLSQHVKIQVKEDKKMSVDEVFDLIMEQTDYKFFYEEGIFKGLPKVDVKKGTVEANDLLRQSLSNANIDIVIGKNNTVIIKEKPKVVTTTVQQKIVVSGRVLDQKGLPLPGANVLEKGTKNGTQTDFDGKFSISVENKNATLEISFLGFNTQDIKVNGQSSITITLQENASTLNEIVVVGYGNQKKKMLTNAVSAVSSKQIKDLPVTSPGAALAGQVAGVTVVGTNGAPGRAPVIRVRGTGSITAGNSPLYVVDGFPLPDSSTFNLISPQDIQSIEVLKDAASAAIYGSRGGNGVVIVTTKRGTKGKTKFSFNSYAGSQQALNKVSVLNTKQLIDYMKEGYANQGLPIPPAYANPAANLPDTDWQDQIFRNGMQYSYQLSASGGSDAVKYSVSGGHLSQDGIVKGTGYERFNLMANLDADLSKRIKVGVSFMPSYAINTDKDTNGSGSEATSGATGSLGGFYGVLGNALMMPSLYPVKYANGNYGQPSIDPVYSGFSPNFTNPVAIIDLYEDKTKTVTLLGNSYLEFMIIEGLKFKTTFGFMNSNLSRNIFTPSTLGRAAFNTATITNPNLNAIAAQRQVGLNQNWVSENYFTYDKTIGDHDFSVLAGYSAQQNVSTMETLTGTSGTFLSDAVHTVGGAGEIKASSFYTGNNLISMYTRLNYSYKDKYILAAAFRRDGSSRFGTNNKYANFPSVSAAWRVKQEKFMDNVDWISDLKLRASYGETGNYNIGDYAWQSYMGPGNYTFGTGNGTINYGYIPTGLSNDNLTWEKNQQTDIGLELGFLKNRIALTADLYRRTTSNLLLNKGIPAINGFGLSILDNIGSVENKGLEIGLLTRNLEGKLKWTTNFNITFNKNKVLELANHVPLFQGFLNAYKLEEGQPISRLWGYKQIGVYQNAADVANSPVWTAAPMKPGDVKFEDYNHDGKVDVNDMQDLGTAAPKYIFGFVNTFQYGNFDLNIVMRGSQGGQNMYAIDRNQFRFFGSVNPRTNVLDRWQSEQNPGNGMEPRVANSNSDTNSNSTRYLHDASFLQITNLTFGYTLPQMKSLPFDSMRFYLTSQNLAMWTKDYPGYNPEANQSNDATLGVDNGSSYPLARSIILGVNLNF
ncbi:SusC/RagA family TonB-linked outer membrane protein [Flavobacterium gilvum]|uniref:TonB-denpendent receptor n=1 Tax=Flavobacterium gilvum TaxID=1492737 RepID=A0AAC9I6U1_9FLAO|nr:TonB-dependent receptor [Flavobacterium gilvum]AOW10785.1 hypothetical protein EM308_15520 [Flavobacterium gilvum]KFC57669.1 hypothetical protein FEM08_35530 [Flavobacterium gilvum]